MPSSSIAETERKQRKSANTQGKPIKLPTKALAVEVIREHYTQADIAFVAEAGGSLSTIKLDSGEIRRIGASRASSAPLTSLAHYKIAGTAEAPGPMSIFAGSWDKTITKYTFLFTNEYSQRGKPPSLVAQTTFTAHSDFIKCLTIAQTADGQPILISGGADGEINFWTPESNKRLATIKPQARSIECIVQDPYSNAAAPIVFFSTSQREIFSIQMPSLAMMSSSTLQSTLSAPLVVHETSVYKIHFDTLTSDMWTASADKTAKRLSRDLSWQTDLTLVHPDFVRDVTTHPRLPYAITACRDEEIRIWNANTGDLYHVLTGHFEEVTALAIVTNDILVSVSIDATLRRWSLNPTDLEAEIEKAKNPPLLSSQDNPEPESNDLGLTEEEEAELKAMMEEEESETLEKMATDKQ